MARPIKFFFNPLIPRYEPWKVTLIEQWDTVMGDLHAHVTLINIQNNMLLLGVYDATWLQELHILSSVLIKTINDFLGDAHIQHLRFKNIGYKKKQTHTTTVIPLKHKIRPRQIPLTHQEHSALATVKDSELRTVLEQYLIRCKEI
jgi:hypothetical protein